MVSLTMTYFHTGNLHYHRRGSVSRSCSGWEGVVPDRYVRQTLRGTKRVLGVCWGVALDDCVTLGPRCFLWGPPYVHGYRIKPHGPLVPVSFMHYCMSTPGLSTWWSSTTLQQAQGLREVSS